jgi:hypothetical protein
MRRVGYQNAVLTAIAVLLALGLVDRQSGGRMLEPAAASAQPEGGLSNALEQRKQMIAELRAMSGRLERIESKISGGLDVRVKDMPPIKFPPEVMKQLNIRPEPAQGAQANITITPSEGR